MTPLLIDGTYELFRAYFGAPSKHTAEGREIGASRALLRSFAALLQNPQISHVGVAFDSVVESFRNELFSGYKTGEGVDPALYAQFPLAERLTRALGLTVWPMIDLEADDALASAAARFADDPRVEQVRIATPDKDLCQCVRGSRVVLFDRKTGVITDEAGVRVRLGVSPAQVPAYLALVGDAADGIPGIPKWGPKSAAALLDHYGAISAIPSDPEAWSVKVRGKHALSEALESRREQAALYEELATLRRDADVGESVDDLRVRAPDRDELIAVCRELDALDVAERLGVR
jgi:5'-3' exonuclease